MPQDSFIQPKIDPFLLKNIGPSWPKHGPKEPREVPRSLENRLLFLLLLLLMLVTPRIATTATPPSSTSISSESGRDSSNLFSGLLGTSWGFFAPCLGQLGPIFEQEWRYLRLLEAILEQSWPILAQLAPPWDPYWANFSLSWATGIGSNLGLS